VDVSVLLPYRDAAGTIGEALGSVLAQRGPKLEILAIDDGSTDGGAAIVQRFATQDRRVRPMATRGVGIVGALQAGLARACGRFVARMDGDDVSLPDRFALQVRRLEADRRLGVVGTQVEAVPQAEVGEGLRRYVAWQNALVSAEDHARDLYVESPLCHPSVMSPRRVLEEVGGWREAPWPEDYDLWLRLHARGYELAKVPKVLLHWRHREGRLTFGDPRYDIARFIDAKAHYLAPWLATRGRPVAVWGAGPTGKRVARALERRGVRTALFVDIDPKKLGRTARGAPIEPASTLRPACHTIVVAVGARGARALVRRQLDQMGFVDGCDYVCAA